MSLLPFEPNPDGTCRACRGQLDPETWLCTRCGAAHGERNRCPHCHTIARTLPHPTLIHRCSVCGKPRFMPGPGAAVVPELTKAKLRAAGQSNRMDFVLRILGYLLLGIGLPGLILTLVILAILTPGAWVTGIALAFALIPLVLWFFVRSRAAAARANRERMLEQAYSDAVLSALRTLGGECDAEAIARTLGISVERAERLLLTLNASDQMTSRVTDDGGLVFGVAEPARYRVGELPDGEVPAPNTMASDDIVDAELEGSDPAEGIKQRRP